MKPVEKIVLLRIADMAHDDGSNAYPAVSTLARDCGLSRRGVQKALARLLDSGYVEIQAAPTNRRSTTYRVVLTACGGERRSPLEADDPKTSGGAPCSPPDPSRGEHGSPPESALEANNVRGGGEPRSPLEVNGATSGGEPRSPDPSGSILQPSYEPPRARDDGRRPHALDETPTVTPIGEWSVLAFDRLYAIYPDPSAKVRANQAWIRLNPSPELAEQIIAAVEDRIRSGWGGADSPHVPFLHTFLAEARWTERYVPRKPVAKAASPEPPRGPVTVWDRVVDRLEKKLNRHALFTWIKPLMFVADDGQTITVRVPDPLFRDWLRKHYRAEISQALVEIGREDGGIAFVDTDQGELGCARGVA